MFKGYRVIFQIFIYSQSLSLAFLLLLLFQIYCPILFLFNYLNKQGQNQRT